MITSIQSAQIYFNSDNTPVSQQFDDVYFCNQNGLAETEYVFLQGNHLWQRWQQHNQKHFVIAETGFGCGLNFLAASQLFQQFRQQFPQAVLKYLFFISFEKYPLSLEALCQAQARYPQFKSLCYQLQRQWLDPIQGCYRFSFAEPVSLDLWFGDIMQSLPQLGDYMMNKIDAWFLDGFAPSKNPDMWRPELYQYMFRFTKAQGTFATFTAASIVRKGLQEAGFSVEKRKGYGKKREMIQGYKANIGAFKAEFPWYLPQSYQGDERLENLAIIGGGVASAFCALALSRRGTKVTLYCADEALAQNASGNRQGAFYPQLSDDDERNIRFYIHSFTYGYQQLNELSGLGVNFEHEFCGVSLCAYDAKNVAKFSRISSLDLPNSLCEPLNAESLSLKLGLDVPYSGLFIKNGGWLAPQQLVQNLFAYLQQQGVTVHCQQSIKSLQQQGDNWILYNQNNQQFVHQAVILTNGHLLDQFAQTQQLPIYPVRGQVSQIPTTTNLAKLRTVLCYDGYLTPMDSSRHHCVGASHVRDCIDITFSLTEQQQNQDKIQHNLAPAAWLNEVDTSANMAKVGVRCAVRDRMPIMGNVADFSQQQRDYENLFNLRRRQQELPSAAHFKNLFILGALGSRGLTSAPLLAECLASLIYAEPIPLSQDILHNLYANRSWIRKWLKGADVK